jgi:DNA-binding NtrC family response regulator
LGYGVAAAVSVHFAAVIGGGSNGVVLVVDDEPAIRLLCRVNLELAGYEVREASTLAEAQERLDDDVSVVLLDMHVGRQRGDRFLAEVKAAGIPVAVVSGSTDLEVLRDLADAVLAKPFAIDDLEQTVARLAHR